MRILPRQIPIKFTKNKNKLELIRLISSFEIPRPTIDNGGIIAAEIAIPITRSDNCGRAYAYVPTSPPRSATIKYRKSGFVLSIISEVNTNVSL